MPNQTFSATSGPVLQSSRTSAQALGRATDEHLVGLARSGSARAFEEIAHRYQQRLRAYCAQFVGPALAEDAVQQALLRAYVALQGESRRDIALRPWLYRIARNCAIDLLRSAPPDHEQLDLQYDGVPQPPRLVEQKEEMGRLVAALHELPEGQRRALTLRELEGRSYQEISQTLGQTGPGVRQMIFRARTALRSGFGALLPAGSMRSRFLGGHHGVPEPQNVVAVTKVSSCGGLEAVGVAAAAALTLVTGMPVTAPAGPGVQLRQPRIASVTTHRPMTRPRPPAAAVTADRGGLTVLRLRPSFALAAGGAAIVPVLGYSVARSAGRPAPAAALTDGNDAPDGVAAGQDGQVNATARAGESESPSSGAPSDGGAGSDTAAAPPPEGSDSGPPASGSAPPDLAASDTGSAAARGGCLLLCGEVLP